jgi:hypothetical protein
MNKTIHMTVLTSDETAVVEATAPLLSEQGEGSVKGTGWSKKHPSDSPDQEVGYNLAVARALRDLADTYEAMADEAEANPQKWMDLSGYVTGPITFTTEGYGDNQSIFHVNNARLHGDKTFRFGV